MGYNTNKLCLVAFACDLAKGNSVEVLTLSKFTLGVPQDWELMQRLR